MRILLIALLLTGCAAFDDSDMVRLEQPAEANRCVAWLMDEDVRPVPSIVYAEEMPWLPEHGFVNGYYDPDSDTVVVHRRFNQAPILLHEISHAYGATERAADSVERRGRDCVSFG